MISFEMASRLSLMAPDTTFARGLPLRALASGTMPIGVSKVFHTNVNCTDLERALGFYRDLVGLTQGAHTVPEPQDGTAFGLETAQWDAWILSDGRGFGAGIAL